MRLYFVTAKAGWDTIGAAHYLAESPSEAIELMQLDIGANPYSTLQFAADGVEWSAKPSKSNRSNAMNARG